MKIITLIALLTGALFATSCKFAADYIPSYNAVNSGKTVIEIKPQESYDFPAEDVSPNFRLPEAAGGGVVGSPQPVTSN